MAPTPDAVRRECYRRITQVMKDGLTQYYRLYPEREGDRRSAAAGDWSMWGINQILEVLNDYDIRRKV